MVIGSGESGTGAAILAKQLGYDVFVSDGGKISHENKELLNQNNVPFEEGQHDFDKLSNVGLILKSPGVPEKSEVMSRIRSMGLKVISEIEFAFKFYEGKILAVTGSNGKTTTSGLLFHMLKTAGFDVRIGGNYGKSFAALVAEGKSEYMVLEVSSFQLDDIDTFKPYISILLNITPDHLDRYDYKMANYVASKFRINKNQDENDFFIINGDDFEINEYKKNHTINGKIRTVNKSDYEEGILSKDGRVFEMALKGQHNYFNARSAVEVCRILNISEDKIGEGLKSFINLPHRLEPVAIIDGVEYLNDSKATNVDSVYYALGAMSKPVVWIAGGTDKGNDYSAILQLVKEKVKALVCMGVDNHKLYEAFEGVVPLYDTHSLEEAIKTARLVSSSGDVVLLSPACASFDLFKNYMDRGDKFKEEILKYK
jgi:UDP-N-acetylmuramoylalanine--D-glutamate ligase